MSRRKWHRLTAEQREQVLFALEQVKTGNYIARETLPYQHAPGSGTYPSEQSFAQVARDFHLSPKTVSTLARAAGIKPPPPRRVSDEKRTDIVAGVEAGRSYSQVAREIGMSPTTVSKTSKAAAEEQHQHAHTSVGIQIGGYKLKISPS